VNEEQETSLSERPEIAAGKVPLWIKVMWAIGIVWVCTYIYLGLTHTAAEW